MTIDVPCSIVAAEQRVEGGIELPELWIILGGEVLKELPPVGKIRGVKRRDGVPGRNPEDPMRPEKMALRIHKPPFAINFFSTEAACSFQLRASSPTAVLIPVIGTGMSG